MFKKIKGYFRSWRWERLKNRVKAVLSSLTNEFDCYVVEIENTNDFRANAIIFGHNKFINTENFGSDKGVVVKNNLSYCNTGYQELLFESQMKTTIESIRFFAKDRHHLVKRNMFTFVRDCANGRTMSIPINPVRYLTIYQYQENIVDIIEQYVIDGSSYFIIPLLPKEKIALTFFNKKREVYN